MKHFTVRQFKDACHARYFGPEEALDQELSGVETDSRRVTKGTLFVAIPENVSMATNSFRTSMPKGLPVP